MSRITSFVLLSVLISGVSLTKQRFDNFKVYSLKVENDEQLKVLENLEKRDYDFWESPMLNDVADVMISPDREKFFEDLMDTYKIERTVKVANVQE